MTTNTNNTELTEKKNTNEGIDGNNNNMESSNDEFSKEINNIYNHIENNTITKDIFKSFINTLNITINNYKQQIQTHKTTTNNNNKKTEILKDQPPTINVNELITSSQLITSFANIQGRSPKCKLFISFYTKFLTIITQSKHNENSLKTVINYSDIDRIICVPEKTDNILLYAKLTKKIPLNWRKSSIDCFAFAFDNPSYIDENDTNELQICNSNTNLPSKITQFCRIISALCNKHINRHDKNLFRTQLESKKSVYYIDATIKFNKCFIYPINSGIFITPKPLRFIPKNEIKYYEYARQGNGLRYFMRRINEMKSEQFNITPLKLEGLNSMKHIKIINISHISIDKIPIFYQCHSQMDCIPMDNNDGNILELVAFDLECKYSFWSCLSDNSYNGTKFIDITEMRCSTAATQLITQACDVNHIKLHIVNKDLCTISDGCENGNLVFYNINKINIKFMFGKFEGIFHKTNQYVIDNNMSLIIIIMRTKEVLYLSQKFYL